jgi:hypothetical protein
MQQKPLYFRGMKSFFTFNYRIFTPFAMSCFIILRYLEVYSAYNTIATTHSAVSVITLAYASPAPSGVVLGGSLVESNVSDVVSDVEPDGSDVEPDESDVELDGSVEVVCSALGPLSANAIAENACCIYASILITLNV